MTEKTEPISAQQLIQSQPQPVELPLHPVSQWLTKDGKWPEHLNPFIQQELMPELNLHRVSAVLRLLCTTARQVFPNPEHWIAPQPILQGELYYTAKIYQKLQQPNFLKSVWPLCILLLGDNYSNKHWLANVVIFLAIHAVLADHQSFIVKLACQPVSASAQP